MEIRVYFGPFFATQLCSFASRYAFSLAIKRSCEKQSNAFDRSFRSAPNIFLLPIVYFHSSNIDKRQRWALNHFPNPH